MFGTGFPSCTALPGESASIHPSPAVGTLSPFLWLDYYHYFSPRSILEARAVISVKKKRLFGERTRPGERWFSIDSTRRIRGLKTKALEADDLWTGLHVLKTNGLVFFHLLAPTPPAKTRREQEKLIRARTRSREQYGTIIITIIDAVFHTTIIAPEPGSSIFASGHSESRIRGGPMDIDGLPPTPSTSRPSTSTSRPSSAGVKLPGIRTLPGFQMQHDSASGSGLGLSSGFDRERREREWSSVGDREREALRDREALKEMEWEREREFREREREREELRGIDPGTDGGLGYDGYGGGRAGLGKERERELSLPMQAPASRPLSMSSSSAMSISMADERPRSRGFTSSATLNSILSVPGPPEPFAQPRPLSSAAYSHPRPPSSTSSALSSPSPFAHGGLPPIGHGLLATGRKGTGGVSGEMGTSGGRWAPGQAMSPSSAGSSSLAHLYAAASASGPFSAPVSSSAAPTMSTSRPSSSHASTSALGMNGYGYSRSRTDSNASVNTHTSGSMTPTSHHRMPMPMSPPTSVSTLSHPRPQQVYAGPPPSHRAVMSPPPLPPSRQHQHQPQGYRAMSPPASISTPAPSSRRGNVNPYLVSQKVQPSPPTGSPYMRSPQLENRRMSPMSPPLLQNQSFLPSRAEVRPVPMSPPLGPTGRYEEEIPTPHISLSNEAAVDERERVVEREKENGRRDVLEPTTTKEAFNPEVDVEMLEANDETRSSSSRMHAVSSPAAAAASLQVPSSSTPNTRHDTLRPLSSLPLPRHPSTSPAAAALSLPPNRAPPSPNPSRTSISHPHPTSSQLPAVQGPPIPPADTLILDDSIRCICGISIDDGFSIACDVCSRWCHTACFRIGQESVPEEWVCWACASSSPNPNGNGHTTGGGGRGKGRGKGKGTGAGTASRQWTPWTKEEVEETRVWARQMQMQRLGLVEAPGGGLVRSGSGVEGGGMLAPPVDVPGATGKRKRRASAVPPFQQQQPSQQPQQEGANGVVPAQDGVAGNIMEGSSGAGAAVGATGVNVGVLVEEEDEEPWTSTYVSITQDVITDPETRARLRRHAQRWRGVIALARDGDDGMGVGADGLEWTDGARSQRPVRVETMLDPDAPNVTVRPLVSLTSGGSTYGADGAGLSMSALTPNPNADGIAPIVPPSSLHTLASASFAYNPLVLPPSYGLHTTSSIPSKALIAPFVSHITSSSTYLSDPLNAYVHLGMPKPYVHLLGPPLEVALDARGLGGKARFARRGCWPNAVVRPVLCDRGKAAANRKGKEKEKPGDGESEQDNGTQLAFGVFALRDLKAGEEVVLGWEWDDGHVVHKLPALLQTPSVVSPSQVPHIKDQMANLLHALASNFVACACGAKVQLGEGCTGHHDRREGQRSPQSRREHGHGYYDDAESDMDVPYEHQEEQEEAPRGRTRERLSVREKRIRQKEKQQACALASMARFVGQDDQSHEHSHSRYGQNHTGWTEGVDLGPLVGSSVKTGIRTREGRFGGVENMQSVYGERERGRSTRNGEVKGRGRNEKWQRYDDTGLDGDLRMRDSRNGRHASSRQSTVVHEPRPPDTRLRHPSKSSKTANGIIEEDETRMPPKMRMRKRWTHTHEQSEVSKALAKADNSVQQHWSTPATSKEIGSMDVDDHTVLQVKEKGQIGLGIRLEVDHAPASIHAPARDPSPLPIPPTTPALDADESPKSTPTMSQTLMPPPSLPSLRDTTTATPKSTTPEPAPASLPVFNGTWSNDVPRSPPRSPGSPSIKLSPSLPRRTSASSDGETQTSGPTPPPTSTPAPLAFPHGSLTATALTNSPSPLVSFANLSLLSPAILSQVRMHSQHPHASRASLQVTPGPSSSLPTSSLGTSSSLSSSYFSVHPTTATTTPAVSSQLHSHPEPSPSTFSFENMDLNRNASSSPIRTSKDGKDWSPLQRRVAESLVRMSESRRSSASETGVPQEPSPLPYAQKMVETASVDEVELIVPSKESELKETCEVGVRVEYPSPQPSTNHAPCAEVDEDHFASREGVDVDMCLPDANPRSQSRSQATIVKPPAVDVDVEGSEEPVPNPEPELELAASEPEAETELQSDESEDLDFPSHRWKRKRKRIVSMDSEAGGRSQSPPYKVARDCAMVGVDVHTSPRPQRERSVPLPAILARASVSDEDAVMGDVRARSMEREEQVQLTRTVSPISVPGIEPAVDEDSPPATDLPEAESMALDEPARSPVADISPAEPGVASALSESMAAFSTPAVHVSESSPQPEAPRKVKLSLADFARRKKQQRQEEERQLELQRALNPPPPPASPRPLAVLAVIMEPPFTEAAEDITEPVMDTGSLVDEPQRYLMPVTEFSSPNPQSQKLDMVIDVPTLDTIVVEPPVNRTRQKDSSPAPSPMSVSPEETAPPPIKFVSTLAEQTSAPALAIALVNPPSPPTPAEPTTQPTRKATKFSPPLVNGGTPKPAQHPVPATFFTSMTPSSPPSTSSTPTPAPLASDLQERQAKQERIEALIPPPPASSKPSRFGPPLTRPLVGLVVHPPAGKPSMPPHTSGRASPLDQTVSHEKFPSQPHVRRHSQAQEDGEIRENVAPASPTPAPQSSRHTWFGRPLPDPPPDPKDLKGWNQYYREVYNLTGSFDPPGVAVRPGMHPPPKGPRSLNLKGEPIGNVNGNMAGQTVPLVSGAPSRSSLPIPTGPRFGIRPGARAPIPDDATRAALAKAKIDAEPSAPPPPVSTAVHSQSPVVAPGPPPLSARIGPPVPRGSSVDYGERDGRDDGDRRGGRDYRPYARGRGRGGGVWRK